MCVFNIFKKDARLGMKESTNQISLIEVTKLTDDGVIGYMKWNASLCCERVRY